MARRILPAPGTSERDLIDATDAMYKRLQKILAPLPVEFSLVDLREWVRDQQVSPYVWACIYCRRWLPIADIELEHKEPVKRGGSSAFANLALSCDLDNRTKGELTAEEYRALLDGLESFGPAGRNYILGALRNAGKAKRLLLINRAQGRTSSAAARIRKGR